MNNMKKPPVLVVIVLICVVLAVLTFAANSFRRRISQKLGENVLEKVIEQQTGGKVDIKSGSNGEDFTIKTQDGQTQYSAGGGVKLPDGFPQELIVVDDAKLIMATSSSTGSSVTYYTNFDQDAVFAKYLANLPVLGWTKDTEINSTQGKMINFSKGAEAGVVTIGENNSDDQTGKTTVNVIWVNDSGN